MDRKQPLSIFGAYALGIFGSLPGSGEERFAVVAGFGLLWPLLSLLPLSRRIQYGLAAAVPPLIWGLLFPSVTRAIAVVLIVPFTGVLWWVHQSPRRWGLAFAALTLLIGAGSAWQGMLGYDGGAWRNLFGLGALAVVSAYMIKERQRTYVDGVVRLARHLAHDISTPLHVIHFCAEQWSQGSATDLHRQKLAESSERANAVLLRRRSELKGWIQRSPQPFPVVWEWATEELEGAERCDVAPSLADETWEWPWVERAGESLRNHVSELCRRHKLNKILVETGSRPPSLRFFLVPDIANSDNPKEGGECTKKFLVSEWRG